MPATITQLTFTQRVDVADGQISPPCVAWFLSDSGIRVSFDVAKIGEILPGDSQYVTISLDLRGCEHGQFINGVINLEYSDPITTEHYSQYTDIEVSVLDVFFTLPSPSPSPPPF